METYATHPLQLQTKRLTSTVRNSYTVFIVEDNKTARSLLENYLRKMPNCAAEDRPILDIYTFETGQDCLNAINIKPDIIILDFYLDEVDESADNGLIILKKIKKQSLKTKVIIMTSQENVMITAELYNKGASDYISKEHYGIVRVSQSILRIINEIEVEKTQRTKNFLTSLVLLAIGILLGVFLS